MTTIFTKTIMVIVKVMAMVMIVVVIVGGDGEVRVDDEMDRVGWR